MIVAIHCMHDDRICMHSEKASILFTRHRVQNLHHLGLSIRVPPSPRSYNQDKAASFPSAMPRVDMSQALVAPTKAELTAFLTGVCTDGRLWKLGSCFEDLLDTRVHNAAHYSPTFFNRPGAMCVAKGMTAKEQAATLETAGIQHLKFALRVGVNVKSIDDVPHAGYSPSRPGALYIVPVLPRFATQHEFWDEHNSYYKLTHGGAGLKAQREAAGLPLQAAETAPRTYYRTPGAHNGGKQPAKHIHMDDNDFVSGLIHSGIPLSELDHAFAAFSCGRFNKLLAKYWKVRDVARELALLFGGKELRDAKFKRVKPFYLKARSSEASSSSTALGIDATEPRLEVELDPEDNLAAVAHAVALS